MSAPGAALYSLRPLKLSVVIPCLNAADTLELQLAALARQRCASSWEVILADNGSTDDSVRRAEAYRSELPDLQIVDASDRPGQAHARNAGALRASGEALLYCDADDEVGEGWLAAMGRALEAHDLVACRIDIAKLNPEWIQRARPNTQGDGLPTYDYPRFLPHAGGGTLGIRRRLHVGIGGFDEGMALLEDTDYCWRLQLAGTPLHFVPDAVVHVRYRPTLEGLFQQARRYGWWNVCIYKRYRGRGMPRLSLPLGLAKWTKLLLTAPRALGPRRGEWMAALGWRVGRLEACLKYRVLAL